MKQHLFSLTQNFDIYDEHENIVFSVQGELFTLGRKLHIYNAKTNTEVATVHQRLLKLLPQFDIYVRNKRVATIEKRIDIFQPKIHTFKS